MKKLLLSLGVIIIFAAYALHQKTESDNVNVVAPSLATPTPSQNALTTPASAGGSTPPPSTAPTVARGHYKDGTYTGSAADAFYGNIQVQAVIRGGKIADVIFLQYPNDRGTSIEINTQAMPYLKQEAIAAQSAQVDIVSGATDSSNAFIQSLGSALSQAKI